MSALLSVESAAWTPAIGADVSTQAREVARIVAGRLRDRDRLLDINRRAAAQSRYPDTLRWNPCALAHGDVGLALAGAYFDQCWPGEGWDDTAATYLAHGVQALRSFELQPGLHGGLSGMAFAMRRQPASNSLRREYLPAIDRALASHVLDAAGRLHQRHGVAVSEFDAISGLAGIGAYLLGREMPPPTDVALRSLLETLADLTGTHDDVPHWFTPQPLMGDNSMATAHPHGNMNCGLAHGIPGPLALMALALSEGVFTDDLADRLAEAVWQAADWLVRRQIRDDFGINWPTVVPRTRDGGEMQGLMGSRAAWCYGAPGVARALWLAGVALGDTALRDQAIEAMAAVYRRPLALRQIDSPTFCHGIAGLLQITLRFAQDTGHALFRDAADALCRQLLGEFRAEQALGFCSVEPAGNKVDQSGLLDGAAGVAMVLLAASTHHAPDWDRVFLLS